MQLLTFTAVTGNQSVLFAFDPEPANKIRQFSKDSSERISMHYYSFEASLLGILSLFGGSLPTLKSEGPWSLELY